MEPSQKKNENKVVRYLYPDFGGKILTPYFSVGDNVRITKKQNLFEKGFTPRWTEEVSTINKIILTIPTNYKLTDLSGEEI